MIDTTAPAPGRPADAADGQPTGATFDPQELRIARLRALRGPNYWRLAPVIACDVRLGALEQVTSADVPGFTERLVSALPSLGEHKCTRGSVGCSSSLWKAELPGSGKQ